ncbi:thiolase-like protein [Immersiella caudata]|uniref:Thiolase-like protein n=1 Tax=Immersiella caudata TaxID=314043 RepID=A0AA39U5E8_9PEZI|nr:thiolase-like protein [Immersiella caudata]
MADPNRSGIYVVGIGHHYPPYLTDLDDLEGYLARFLDTNAPSVKKLLQVNRKTGIKERPNIIARDDPLFNRAVPPTISELDQVFRTRAVDLAARACRKAIADWGGTVSQITHTVAVTGSNAGSPGYDVLVNEKLGVPGNAQRALLSGVGCAGGLATLRVAATMANDATLRGRPARILGYACDLTSTNIRCDLTIMAENPNETRVSMALFSDAAAAFIVCNELALDDDESIIYSVLDWENGVLKNTLAYEQSLPDPLGFRFFMSPELPDVTSGAVGPLLETLLARNAWRLPDGSPPLPPTDLDWAVHPAGLAVLDKVKENMALHDGQMRACFDVFEGKGSSASPTVLIVLDRLRKMGKPKENIVATSFGPGICVEMLALRSCSDH